MNADDIPQHSISLDSDTAYIATINITEDALYGQWRIIIDSQESFSVQILGNSGLVISTQLFTSNSNGGGNIDDTKPLEGEV